MAKNILKTLALSVVLIGVVYISGISIVGSPIPQIVGSGAPWNDLGNTATNTKISVGATSTQIMTGKSGRLYALIVNDSASDIYLGLGEAAVMNEGILILANGGAYEINPDNLFTGIIYGISSGASKNVTVIEK